MTDTDEPRGDPQDVAEALDAAKITDDELHQDEALGDYPPDRPLGVDAWGVTPEEERLEEPLMVRVAHEEPEFALEPDEGPHMELVDAPMEDGRAVADAVEIDDPLLPAEESALHVEEQVEGQ